MQRAAAAPRSAQVFAFGQDDAFVKRPNRPKGAGKGRHDAKAYGAAQPRGRASYEKTGPREGPGLSVPVWGPTHTSRGEHAAHRRLWEDIQPVQQRAVSMPQAA